MEYRDKLIAMIYEITHEGVLKFIYSLFYVVINDDDIVKAMEDYAEN